MIIKQDERFQYTADAQLDIWCAEDEGGHADDDYGLSKATVSALVARRALEDYE